MNKMERCNVDEVWVLVRFSRRSGKIDTQMTCHASAMLMHWSLMNTTPSKDCVIFRLSDGEIAWYAEGQKGGWPKIDENPEPNNIEDYCPGLLEEFQSSYVEDEDDEV